MSHPTAHGESAVVRYRWNSGAEQLAACGGVAGLPLREMGIEVELDEVRRQIGKGGDELVPVFVPWWKQKHVQEPLEARGSLCFRRSICRG